MRRIDADAFTRRLEAVLAASLTPAQVIAMVAEEPTVEPPAPEESPERVEVFRSADGEMHITIKRKGDTYE